MVVRERTVIKKKNKKIVIVKKNWRNTEGEDKTFKSHVK